MTLLYGVPEYLRPVMEIDGNQTFWDLMAKVNARLKRSGLNAAAAEFRSLAAEECDGDNGMLITLALNYVRVPNQAYVEDMYET